MRGLHCASWLAYFSFCLSLAIPLGGASRLSATEPGAGGAAHRRAAMEQRLQAPLEWKNEGRDQVTLAGLLAHLEQHHDLSIRWDIGALRLILDGNSPLGGLIAPPAPLRSPPPYAAYRPPSPEPLPAAVPPTQNQQFAPPVSQEAPPQQLASPVYAAPITPPGPEPLPAAVPPTQNQQLAPPVSQEPPPQPQAPDRTAVETGAEPVKGRIETLLHSPVSTNFVAFQGVSVEEGLRQLLDAVSPAGSPNLLELGVPLSTRALDLDLLVDDHSLIITTRLRANSAKETRVYRTGRLPDASPEDLVRVITHTVRPWSWRGQTMEIAERLAVRWPKDAPAISLQSADSGGVIPAAVPELSEESVAALGQLLAGGAEAFVHSLVAALEILHHGDPPTGAIESIPGFLIITQSQGAHREIRELLDQLAEAD